MAGLWVPPHSVGKHLDDIDLVAIASGLRPAEDRALRHWARCAHCRRRKEELATTLAGWASPVVPVPPAPVPTALPSARRPWMWAPALAVLFLLLMVWPKLGWPSRSPWGPTGVAVLAAGHMTSLRPVAASSGAVGLRWGPDGWALLSASGLPSLPAHRVYEVWWIAGHRHIEASVFRPSGSGTTLLWLYSPRHFQGVNGIGITSEPAPGSPKPTGPREFYAPLVP